MTIVYTCPKCGHDLTEYVSELGIPYRYSCNNCGWYSEIHTYGTNQINDEIIRIPYTDQLL